MERETRQPSELAAPRPAKELTIRQVARHYRSLGPEARDCLATLRAQAKAQRREAALVVGKLLFAGPFSVPIGAIAYADGKMEAIIYAKRDGGISEGHSVTFLEIQGEYYPMSYRNEALGFRLNFDNWNFGYYRERQAALAQFCDSWVAYFFPTHGTDNGKTQVRQREEAPCGQ
jgi:hypothetical protein